MWISCEPHEFHEIDGFDVFADFDEFAEFPDHQLPTFKVCIYLRGNRHLRIPAAWYETVNRAMSELQ